MLDRIKKFFDAHLVPEDDAPELDTHQLHLAAGALIMEMIRIDDDIHPAEQDTARRVLQANFGLTDEETDELIELANEEAHESISYHQFTSLINDGFTLEQKVKVVEMLWRVAYADEHLEKYEEHLVRKVAELLYVPHTQFMAAKHRVLNSLGREA